MSGADLESILTDVVGQSLELILTSSRVGPLTPDVGRRVASPEPLRLAMLIVPDLTSTGLWVAPNQQTGPGPPLKLGGGQPVLIHSATHPFLAGGEWWVTADAADTVTVYQVIRRQ